MSPEIEFRSLREDDISLIQRWLTSEFVSRWYHSEDLSIRGVANKYLPRISGADPCQVFIFSLEGVAAGMVQTYAVADFPLTAARIGEDTIGARSIDIFIGEERFAYQGNGARVIEQFIEQIVFADKTVKTCYVEPEAGNFAAIRAYEKAGFVFRRRLPASHSEPEGYLMEYRSRGGSGFNGAK